MTINRFELTSDPEQALPDLPPMGVAGGWHAVALRSSDRMTVEGGRHSWYVAAAPQDDAAARVASIDVAHPAILLVEDDPGTVDVFRIALQHSGYAVRASTTGQSAIELVGKQPIDLIVVDLKLPDMSGLEVLRHVHLKGNRQRLVLVSAFLTIETCVEAMRLGAFDVLEKPISIDQLLAAVRAGLGEPASGERQIADVPEAMPLPYSDDHPRSAAHRWAMYVMKACEADDDLRTLEDWARWAGVSYSTLCEACRIVGIQPHVARDFTRTLRAMIKSSIYQCAPSVLLDVSDRRTLKALLERAGPLFKSGDDAFVLKFIAQQRFVPSSNEGIRALLGYVQGGVHAR
jgi:DNA-binding response OmpR family regulator